MAQAELVVRSERVVFQGGERPAAVHVSGGVIISVLPYEAPVPKGASLVDLGPTALLPGLVDSHVHVNEPGRTEWEGFATATRAALAGGVTTLVDMPLNAIPPTVDPAALEVKRKAAEGAVFCDVGFWGGLVPGNLGELTGLHQAGVHGFKCFTVHSGVDEFPACGPEVLRAAAAVLKSFDGLLIVHAEDPELISDTEGRGYGDFLASRPHEAETRAIGAVIDLARRTGIRVHILHLSSAAALPLIAEAKRDGVRITAETCPHYLCLHADQVADGDTRFKCCPPIREESNRAALWRGLAEGVIDCVVSDHSPCTPELKRLDSGDFGDAWGGISSLQLGLPLVWSQARDRGHSLVDVVRWMSAFPAGLADLPRKGAIAVGRSADLVAFDPDAPVTVEGAALHHRHPVTPYDGMELTGAVRRVWLRGVPVSPEGDPQGRLLSRGTTTV